MEAIKRVLSVTAQIFLIAILVSIAVASGFGLIAIVNKFAASPPSVQVAAASIRIVAILMSLLISVLLALGLLCSLRAVWRRRSKSFLAGIIGLAFATLLFPRGVYALLTWPFWYAARLSRSLFDLAATYRPSLPDSGTIPIDVLAAQLAQILQEVADKTLSAGMDLLSDAPLPQILFALMVWILMSLGLSARRSTSEGVDRSLFGSWWASLTPSSQGRYGVIAVLLFGAYLSIAAVIAVPWVSGDETNNQFLTKDRLAQQLTGALLKKEDLLTSGIGDSLGVINALNSVIALTDTARAHMIARNDPEMDQLLVMLDPGEGESFIADRHRLVNAILDYWNVLSKRQRTMLDDALVAFENQTSTQMSGAERVFYVQQLNQWFRESMEEDASRLGKAQHRLTEEDKAALDWARGRRLALERTISFLNHPPNPVDENAFRNDIGQQLLVGWPTPSYVTGEDYLRDTQFASRVPNPPEAGLGWGLFGSVARWLLRTRSIALTQIAGMLGVGFFGAAISVLRHRLGTAMIRTTDVWAIVISGFSATLVVFLAVNGGLTVVSQGDAQPNSYILFLVCLIGAVYSEDVWRWAKKRLGQTLSQPGSDRELAQDEDQAKVPGGSGSGLESGQESTPPIASSGQDPGGQGHEPGHSEL